MSNKERALILDSLAKVQGPSFMAYCIGLFVDKARLKTDDDIVEMLTGLQDQARDNEPVMKQRPGKQFTFLMSLRFRRQIAA